MEVFNKKLLFSFTPIIRVKKEQNIWLYDTEKWKGKSKKSQKKVERRKE